MLVLQTVYCIIRSYYYECLVCPVYKPSVIKTTYVCKTGNYTSIVQLPVLKLGIKIVSYHHSKFTRVHGKCNCNDIVVQIRAAVKHGVFFQSIRHTLSPHAWLLFNDLTPVKRKKVIPNQLLSSLNFTDFLLNQF